MADLEWTPWSEMLPLTPWRLWMSWNPLYQSSPYVWIASPVFEDCGKKNKRNCECLVGGVII